MTGVAEPADRQIEEWQRAMARVCDLVLSQRVRDGQLMDARVPATPAWTGRDLLSHMVGLGSDVVAGQEPDDHNADWTQAHVDSRAGRSEAELVAEWRALAPDLVSWMVEHGARPLGDVVIHEQDLRGALRAPGGTDSAGFDIVRDRMAERFRSSVEDLPPILLVATDADGWHWCSDEDPSAATVVVGASGADLGRALMSRRSAEQLRAWTIRGDITPYLAAFEVLGPLPDHPLSEG